MKMSENSLEEITVQKVFDSIAIYMKDAHDVLFNVLNEEPHYKRLLKMGEMQYFDAPHESSADAESMKSRLAFSKVNYLALEVDRELDKIVQEKFQGENLDKLKDEVLRAILLLSSGDINNFHVTCQTSIPSIKIEKDKEKEKRVLPTIKNNKSTSVQNSLDTEKQRSNGTNGQAKLPLQSAMDTNDNWNPDISIISFDSVSSVHTSDLSSYEDEISVSSEEEFGEKRRLSLREVQEKLEKTKSEVLEEEEEDDIEDEQSKNHATENAQSGSRHHLSKNNASSSISQKSRRRRKPNIKYNNDDITYKKKSVGKISSTSQSTTSSSSDTRRKRGRPRKYFT